ncbi:MAG TPA: FlgD immunoglobulin-like domain containing protein [bacterium]
MFSPRCYASTVFTLVFLISAATGFSQSNTLDRSLEPVIVSGATLPDFAGVAVSELFLYAYTEGGWQQIPFQFDERGIANGDTSFFIADDGQLDDNDELVFMAKDAGGRVEAGNWVEDENSRTSIRYEIEVADPLAQNGKAWAYLYRSNTITLDPNLTDYVDYFVSTTNNAGQDTIRSLFYNIAHFTNGFPRDLSITSEGGGNGQDLLDILKFRSQATLGLPVNITENNFSVDAGEDDRVFHKDGLVRVIRGMDITISVSLFKLPFATPPFFYYPYSAEINLDVPAISGATVNTGRMSFDLNTNASGMKFVSANNPEPGFTVDGVVDSPQKEIDSVLPSNNWIYINGTPGTIVHLFPLAKTVGNSRQLYYKDNSATDANDTGDRVSYGDTGNDISGGITPPATFSYTGYFLSSEYTSAIGAQIAQFESNPFAVTATGQTFIVDAVALSSFSLLVEQNNVRLSWITASEVSNLGFEVERRAHGLGQWQTIGFVKGAGTSRDLLGYSYVNRHLHAGAYDFRLKMLDINGAHEYSSIITAVIGLPESFALMQNFPNPFNPTTEIRYQLPFVPESTSETRRTVLKIYNLLGEEIRTLVDRAEAPGFYSVTWDGKDKSGRTTSSGIYIYRLQSGNFVETRRMVFLQ